MSRGSELIPDVDLYTCDLVGESASYKPLTTKSNHLDASPAALPQAAVSIFLAVGAPGATYPMRLPRKENLSGDSTTYLIHLILPRAIPLENSENSTTVGVKGKYRPTSYIRMEGILALMG